MKPELNADNNQESAWYKKFPPLTGWFPETVMPVHNGVYMVDQSRQGEATEAVFALWEDGHWYPAGSLPEKAARHKCYGHSYGSPPKKFRFRRWRGLKEAQ